MDLEDFRALARSAPWRWGTVRLTVRWHPGHGPDGPLPPVEGDPVRAWVDGRHGLRVEDLATGRLLTAQWSQSPGGWRGTGGAGGALAGRRGLPVRYEDGGQMVAVDDYDVDDARAPGPTLRADGLVASRPPSGSGPDDGLSYDSVLWQARPPVRLSGPPHGRVGPEVEVVDHHGRPAWQAVVAPTEDYDPRCTCCPLLPGEVASRYLLAEGGTSPARLAEAAAGWPTAHRVRLDAATGIVVELEQVDGHGAGGGWTAVVEAVDERYDRAWFC